LHKKFRKYRLRGEWFKENQKLLDYIDEKCLGGEKFTVEKLEKEIRLYLPCPHLIDNANVLNLGGYHLKALADKKQEYVVGFQGSEKNIIKWLKDNEVNEVIRNEVGNMLKSFDNQTQTSSNGEETVCLIASGYEWTCPHCGKLNEEIEIPEKVKCAGCAKEYEVENADHAWG
jgi:DNA-directed RNA polymerase subunit RPC12/RpoP